MDSFEKIAYTYFQLESLEHAKKLREGLLKFIKTDDISELLVEFVKEAVECEFVDNLRFYPHDMREEFYKVADSGCCGSANFSVKCKSGNLYRVGFNYGH